jgi:hypothetical protein
VAEQLARGMAEGKVVTVQQGREILSVDSGWKVFLTAVAKVPEAKQSNLIAWLVATRTMNQDPHVNRAELQQLVRSSNRGLSEVALNAAELGAQRSAENEKLETQK